MGQFNSQTASIARTFDLPTFVISRVSESHGSNAASFSLACFNNVASLKRLRVNRLVSWVSFGLRVNRVSRVRHIGRVEKVSVINRSVFNFRFWHFERIRIVDNLVVQVLVVLVVPCLRGADGEERCQK